MATLNIEGVGRVQVDESFLKLSPEAQAKTVDEIVASVRANQPKAEAEQPKPKSLLRRVDDVVRGVADTLTFGYADEIAAGLDRLTGINTGKQGGPAPKNYEEALAAQRARDAEGGGERVVGQIGGAFIPVVKGAQLAKAGLTKLGITPTAVKTGMVTGGASAGLYGTGSAEGDITNRLVEGAQAVPVGAALGAAAPVVVDKAIKGGSAVVDKAKDLLNIPTSVERLSPAAQKILQDQVGGAVDTVTPKAAKALEKLSDNPTAVASDLRVRDLFLSERARVLASDPQRALPDDVIFKNVGDKLKRTAMQTVDDLVKAGDIDGAAAKEVKAVVSRAARHNRAITGALKDEELAAELAKGFKTDDAIIDALKIPRQAKTAIKDAIKDLDTVTFNSLKKNQGGIFEAGGRLVGDRLGMVGGVPGQAVGRAVGGGTGRILDKVLMQQGTAPVLKRTVDRLAQGLDEAGVKAGDTVGSLQAVSDSAAKKLATRAAAEESTKKLVQERLNAQNIALARARAPYAEGSKLGPNASPQATLVEAFEDATGIKHKPGMVQDVLKAIKKDENFGPAFSKEVDQAIKALGNKPGKIDNLTNLVRAVRAKAAEQQALGTLKVRQGQTVETGAGRVRNAERYNAKVIENTLRDILDKGE